jgi:1-deoxyxylulose-5-phosphate synthase
MQYGNLGQSGLQVSRVCLGCMSFGGTGDGPWSWTLDEEASRPIFRRALEGGVNFFDTANVYSAGASEEILGKFLKEFVSRDEAVVATKVYAPVGKRGPNLQGLSRKAIFQSIDASLSRLGLDYVDLYQIHRWDDSTPIEETMEALHDLVKAGKTRYIGASTMYAWQFAKALGVAEKNHWTRFVSMQNFVNLMYREEEREMLPLCKAEGIGVIPWSPLARGRLARPWQSTTNRSEKDVFGKKIYGSTTEADHAIVDKVAEVAKKRGVPMAQVALAWVLQKSEVTSPIVGATKPEHLRDAVASLELKLSAEEVSELEAPYVPHAVAGFI